MMHAMPLTAGFRRFGRWRTHEVVPVAPAIVEPDVPAVDPLGPWSLISWDWAWRPELWTAAPGPDAPLATGEPTTLSPTARLFHDCSAPDGFARVIAHANAPNTLELAIRSFSGSYLSLAQSLPQAAWSDLGRAQFFALTLAVTHEIPCPVFARLNIANGPNTAQVLRQVQLHDGQAELGFDMAHVEFNEHRIREVWLDLIFEAPGANRIGIADLTLARAWRAEV